jgi:hypothetical protein
LLAFYYKRFISLASCAYNVAAPFNNLLTSNPGHPIRDANQAPHIPSIVSLFEPKLGFSSTSSSQATHRRLFQPFNTGPTEPPNMSFNATNTPNTKATADKPEVPIIVISPPASGDSDKSESYERSSSTQTGNSEKLTVTRAARAGSGGSSGSKGSAGQ